MVTVAPVAVRASCRNATSELGASRKVLLSSNSTSATPSPVRSRVPAMIGIFANAGSKPRPVLRSICTTPRAWLSRTIRSCETPASAATGAALFAVVTAEGWTGLPLASAVAATCVCAPATPPSIPTHTTTAVFDTPLGIRLSCEARSTCAAI